MKNLTKKALTLLLAVMLVMSVFAQALADDEYDGSSGFRIVDDPGTDDDDTEFFNLIKDYNSENQTYRTNSDSSANAPLSNSPEEIFTFIITPYYVWNAGSSYSTSGSTSTATVMTKATMPMPLADSSYSGTDITYTTSGSGESRQFIVTQKVAVGNAADSNDTATDSYAKVVLPTYPTVGDYWYKVVENIGATYPNASSGDPATILGPTTGVFYGTNDLQTNTTASSNGTHTATYYIHVQAIDEGAATLTRSVTMHKTAPDSTPGTPYATDAAYNSNYGKTTDTGKYVTGDKVNAIANTYYAGDLTITKAVTGNGGDKTEYFPVTVTFNKPTGTVVNSDITFSAPLQTITGSGDSQTITYTNTDVTIKGQYYTGAASSNTLKWSSTTNATDTCSVTATFYVQDGTTVTFSNIPYGVNYSVTEGVRNNSGYSNALTFATDTDTGSSYAPAFNGLTSATLNKDTDSSAINVAPSGSGDYLYKSAAGSITDEHDTIGIENHKEIVIDVGVITENAPYVALVAVAAAGIILLAIRRKKAVED